MPSSKEGWGRLALKTKEGRVAHFCIAEFRRVWRFKMFRIIHPDVLFPNVKIPFYPSQALILS